MKAAKKAWSIPPKQQDGDSRVYSCLVVFDNDVEVRKEIQGRENAREWVENVANHGYWFGEDDSMSFYPAGWVTLAEIQKVA